MFTQTTSTGGARSVPGYGDADLHEFMAVIQRKLAAARKEFHELRASLGEIDDGAEANTARDIMGSNSEQMDREGLAFAAQRLRKFIDQLEAAEVRVRMKRYGICSVTGRLIPKERLLLVPHTTQCVEAKERGPRSAVQRA